MFGGHAIEIKRLFPQILLFAGAFFAVFSSPGARAQDYTSNLVSHWNFDEGALSFAFDSGTGANDAQLQNMAPGNWITPGRLGNSHLSFDGTNDYLSLGAAGSLSFANNVTVAAWVKKSASNSAGPIFNRGNPGSNGYSFGVGEAPCPVTAIKATKYGVADICLSTTPQDTQWHHYAVVWSTTGVSAYVDGELTGSSANITNFNLSLGDAYIGSNEDLLQFFPGEIDDVRVYSRALSTLDIQALYNLAGGPGTCDSAHQGVMIYNSDLKIVQYCNGTDWISAGADCPYAACGASSTERVVFVTPGGTGDHDGVSGADATCQLAAETAGLRGQYYAWIADSDDSSAPEARFEHSEFPYVMANGTKVADDWTDLTDGSLDAAINYTAAAEYYPHHSVWSNVASNGKRKDASDNYHCGNWDSSSAMWQGHRGNKNFTNGQWTDIGLGGACNNGAQLLCFEQGPPADGTCTNPDGVEGEIGFNAKHAVMQFCNGSSWINMGPKIAGISPADNVPSVGLIANWKLDDGIADINTTTAADSSGNGYNGTLNNMTPASDWLLSAKDGGALDFDGTNDYISVSNNAAFSIKDLTLSAWIYIPTSVPASYRAIVWQSSGGDNNYSLWLSGNANKLHFRWSNGWSGPLAETNMYMDSNMSISADTWYHVVGTYDDPTNTAKLYINGVLDRTKTGANDPVLTNLGPRIGADASGSYFPGRIDDVRIYGRDLNADEVEALYLGTGGQGSPDPCAGNPAIGTMCADGSVYAGTSPDGSIPMFAAPCDVGMTWDGSTCNGTATQLTWNDGSEDWFVTNIISTTDGDGNTTSLSAAVDIGSPYEAAIACNNFEYGGSEDWYLPSQDELILLQESNGLIGNFNTAAVPASRYWSSTESDDDAGRSVRFDTGGAGGLLKDSAFKVRCIRKGPTTGVFLGSCTAPDGAAGEIIFNTAHNVMQYCNGTNWVGMK